jgi:Domain of unknown function (DUF4878)
MKNLFVLLTASILLFSCNNSNTSSPTNAINAFLDAMKKGDQTAFKSMLTKKDVEVMEAAEKMAKSMGLSDETTKQMKDEYILKAKSATYTIKSEKVEGDKATVDVEIKDADKTDTQQFNLVKENGAWKISLFAGMGGIDMKEFKGAADSLKSLLKGVNMDSAVNSMRDLFKDAEKNKGKLEELGKKMEEEAKKFENSQK